MKTWPMLFVLTITTVTADVRADELTSLRKQIDELGNRASDLEAERATGEGAGAVTLRKGQGTYSTAPERATDRVGTDAGVTIAVSPDSAVAPTAELSISEEVRVLLSKH